MAETREPLRFTDVLTTRYWVSSITVFLITLPMPLVQLTLANGDIERVSVGYCYLELFRGEADRSEAGAALLHLLGVFVLSYISRLFIYATLQRRIRRGEPR